MRKLNLQPSSKTVTLERHRHSIEVRPALASLIQRLHAPAGYAFDRGQGLQTARVPIRLGHHHPVLGQGEPPCLVYGAGLAPVVRKIVEEEGYEVKYTGLLTAPLPAPVQSVAGPLPADDLLLRCVQQHERALVRYREGDVDLAWLIAQIALAWPELRLVCLVHSYEEGRSLRDRVQKYLPAEPVRFFNRTNAPEVDCRVVLATPLYLHHPSVRKSHRDIVIFPDALQGLGKKVQEELDEAWNARLYGLIGDKAKSAPLDEAQLRERFSFQEIFIPQHGHVERGVEVVWHLTASGKRIWDDAIIVTLKRQGLWQNAVRNRRIARLARAVSEGDVQTLTKDYPSIASELPDSERHQVLIVVENVEHALQLAKQLKGWPLFCDDNVCRMGLSRIERKLLHTCTQIGRQAQTKGIITTAGLEKHDLSEIDVLLRADGGRDIPVLGNDALICPQERPAKRLLLIDTNDRHHPKLRQWTTQRRRAYQKRGWYCPGKDHVEERITEFLARSDQMTGYKATTHN